MKIVCRRRTTSATETGPNLNIRLDPEKCDVQDSRILSYNRSPFALDTSTDEKLGKLRTSINPESTLKILANRGTLVQPSKIIPPPKEWYDEKIAFARSSTIFEAFATPQPFFALNGVDSKAADTTAASVSARRFK